MCCYFDIICSSKLHSNCVHCNVHLPICNCLNQHLQLVVAVNAQYFFIPDNFPHQAMYEMWSQV